MKPTQREVRVILNSFGVETPVCMFNDKRKFGGRIKLWDVVLPQESKDSLQLLMQTLFPDLKIEVRDNTYKYDVSGRPCTSTCVYWTEKAEKDSLNGKVVEIEGKQYKLFLNDDCIRKATSPA